MGNNKGLYLGTEIDEKWWKRYKKDKFLTRGNGEYWYDDKGFYFLRYFTEEPIIIPFSEIIKIKLGKWHSGRWAYGNLIIKIVWKKENLKLSSGFIISKNKEDVVKFIEALEIKIKNGYLLNRDQL